MLNKYIALFLLSFLVVAAPASADNAVVTAAAKQEKEIIPPADMGDEALASYISGRLNSLLKDGTREVLQSCDETGCSVVVQ